jgi:MoaA/NifB/PqqE/SkfB family radical SAM enzyme
MRPRHRLEPAILESIASSRFADAETWFALQGGEFTLHPRAGEILDLFAGTSYVLFSNMLNPDRVIGLVRRHGVKHVTVSLDGGPEGYARIRGVDAFDRVTAGILQLQQDAEVAVGITLTPWSRYEDYAEAADFCRSHDVPFGVNIYTDSRIYQAAQPPSDIPFLDRIVEETGDDFCAAYLRWRAGTLDLGCHSIRSVASISPDGEVHLCHNQDVILGNINDTPFDDIWGSDETSRIHAKFAACNACWTSCYRVHDLRPAVT